jgi:hypothetical protein
MWQEEPTGVIERGMLGELVSVTREPPTLVIERNRLVGLVNDSIPPEIQIRFTARTQPAWNTAGTGTVLAPETRTWWRAVAAGALAGVLLGIVVMVSV